MTRAFISGCAGMTGSYLCEHLLANTDWDLFGLAHRKTPARHERLKIISGDMRNPSIDIALEQSKPNFIFHLAAQSDTAESFKQPQHTYDVNIGGTTRLLEAVRNLKLDPIIHICSSSEIFGRVSKAETPITETCRFHPASPYAISRVGVDLIGQFYAEAYGLRIVITRAFTHTGPRRSSRFVESSFAKQIAMIEANKADPVIYVGNLSSMRTWCDVRDMVRAYHLAVITSFMPRVCNIGGDHQCSVGEMLSTLLKLSTRQNIDVVADPDRFRPIDADLQIPDDSKFRNATGWQPEIPFEQTMQDLLDHWRKAIGA